MKWYEEFPDVGFVEKLLAELDWSDFLFIHIGEKLDEIDTRGSFRDPPLNLGISRSIIIRDPTTETEQYFQQALFILHGRGFFLGGVRNHILF